MGTGLGLCHQDLLFKKHFIPLFCRHSTYIQGIIGVGMLDDSKEFLAIEGRKTWIWENNLSLCMVSEENLMKEAVSECGVQGGLQKSSN